MSDSDNEIEFDNLLKITGGKEFFESILGGIEKQEINSDLESISDSDDSSESDSESDSSISPLYANSISDSETESIVESPLFESNETENENEIISDINDSPLFETFEKEDTVKKNEKKTVSDIKNIITQMTKLL